MSTATDSLVDKVAEAVLYEGYILYPYRASSRKNRERFTFGRVYPQAYSAAQNGAEPFVMQTECLAHLGETGGTFAGHVRFLHAMAREVSTAEDPGQVISDLRIDGTIFQTWHEAVEREVAIPELPLDAAARRIVPFSFPASDITEMLHDKTGRPAGMIRRKQRELAGDLEVAVERVDPVDSGLAKITVRIANRSPMADHEMNSPEALLLSTFASTHTILRASGPEFLSLTDPPPEHSLAATTCENIGTWPVLAGEEGTHECMLSSPIILYDYPRIAPESPGALGDGTEIDEILTLRVMTMTDAEKEEMRNVDGFARRILERTESLGQEDLMKMHGTLRDVHFPGGDLFDENSRLDSVSVQGVRLETGDRVRICPKSRAGRYRHDARGENRADRGDRAGRRGPRASGDRAGGRSGARPRHDAPAGAPVLLRDRRGGTADGGGVMRVLAAGIGNIFMGDDAFGCEVAAELAKRRWPEGVRVHDFGIRSYDLAYAIMDGYDAVILIDAMPRGELPGTVSLIEPMRSGLGTRLADGAPDAHSMNPLTALQLVRSLGGEARRIYVVGCEPAVLETDEIGLSDVVRAAVPGAAGMVEALIHELIRTRESPLPIESLLVRGGHQPAN